MNEMDDTHEVMEEFGRSLEGRDDFFELLSLISKFAAPDFLEMGGFLGSVNDLLEDRRIPFRLVPTSKASGKYIKVVKTGLVKVPASVIGTFWAMCNTGMCERCNTVVGKAKKFDGTNGVPDSMMYECNNCHHVQSEPSFPNLRRRTELLNICIEKHYTKMGDGV